MKNKIALIVICFALGILSALGMNPETDKPVYYVPPETRAVTEPTESIAPTEETQAPTEAEAPNPTTKNSPQSETEPVADEDGLFCNAAFLYTESDGVLYSKGDMETTLYPASLTKLFSVYVALDYLSPSDEITVGEELKFVHSGSSIAKLKAGYRMTAQTVIAGMLLPSGNDAAFVLANAAGKVILQNESAAPEDAVAAFVAQMNAKADGLGFKHSHFTCPDGWHDSNHYTCMADMITIAQLALNKPEIADTVKRSSVSGTFLSGEAYSWFNTNSLLREGTEYYRADAVGLKTGFTAAAGYCLLGAEMKNGRMYIVGIFGSKTVNSRFADACTLLEKYE